MQCIACYHMNEEEINNNFKIIINNSKNGVRLESKEYNEYIQRKYDFEKYGDFQILQTTELGNVSICPKCGIIRKIKV